MLWNQTLRQEAAGTQTRRRLLPPKLVPTEGPTTGLPNRRGNKVTAGTRVCGIGHNGRPISILPDRGGRVRLAQDNIYAQHRVTHQNILFKKTVTGNSLLSDSWLRASNEVIKGLPGIFKQVENLLIGRARLRVTCGDSWSSAGEVPEGSNKVQVGPKVSFASYVASSMLIPRR